MGGWCTKRRFQASGPCLFGCLHGEGSVHHYLACSRLHGHGAWQLRLHVPDLPGRRQTALLLDPASSMDDGTLCCRALLLAAAYGLHCSHRRKGFFGSEEETRRALSQAVKIGSSRPRYRH